MTRLLAMRLVAITASCLWALLPAAGWGAPLQSPVAQADPGPFVPDELVVAFRPGLGAEAVTSLRGAQPPTAPAAARLDALLASVDAVFAERVHRSLEDGSGKLKTTARGRAEATAHRFAERSARGSLAGPIPDLEDVYRVRLAEGSDVLSALARIAADPDVVYVEPNYIVSIDATPLPDLPLLPNDRYISEDGVHWSEGAWAQEFPDLWGIQDVGTLEAWNGFDVDGSGDFEAGEVRPGEGVVVAVIDSGLDPTHPEIAANVWRNPGEIPDNGIDDDANGFIDDVAGWDFVEGDNDPDDESGHGTHVAGTIAAVGNNGAGVIGVAAWAKVLPVKGFNATGQGSIVDLARAVRYSADAGADVLSNSWGGSSTPSC